jgi:phosphohistidine phosphatase
MRLYLLRHGIAEDRRPDLPDAARRLTPEGIAKMIEEAKRFAAIGLKPDAILTSPLPRASETARIVAESLAGQVREDDRLTCGCSFGEMQSIVRECGQAAEIMLVGHEPDLSMIASDLVGGANIDLKKGGLIRIDIDSPDPGQGILKWLLAPATLLSE